MCYTVDMKFRLNDRQKGWVATILITVILSFLLYAAFFRGAEIVRSLRYLTRQMMSLVCGVAIAYILSPVLSFIERKITIPLCSRAGVDVNSPSSGKKRRRVRMFSVVLTILFFLIILYGLIRSVLPQVFFSIQSIINNLPAKESYMLPGYALSYVTGKHYYSENRIWIDREGHMMHSVPARDMSKNAQALAKLYRDCRRLRKRFLFVLCPGKPMEDGVLSDYGFDAYANQNADELLDLLKKFGVPCMDLRPAFKAASGGDIDRYFYRTEHHWNASGGLLAASAPGPDGFIS